MKEQLGGTSDLWALGDFLMKIGEYKKAEKYYNILEKNLELPEMHVDRARIYNRLGIIRREEKELKLAIDYFKKAVAAAPLHSAIGSAADCNIQTVQREVRQEPPIFLGRRLTSSDVLSKCLVASEFSQPILENNLGYAAYHERDYDNALIHYRKALSMMIALKLTYIHEISCVYNNIGVVSYDQQNYSQAKEYFLKAISILQQFTSNHPWITEYKQNLIYAGQRLT